MKKNEGWGEAITGAIIGFLPWVYIYLLLDGESPGLWIFLLSIPSMFAGLMIGDNIHQLRRRMHKRRKAKQDALNAPRLRAEHDAQQLINERDSIPLLLTQNAGRAVGAFALVPEWLNASRRYADDASHHYRNSAFSPFWSSIESAYNALGQCLVLAAAITHAAKEHGRLVARFEELGGGGGQLLKFPIELNVSKVRLNTGTVADDLHQKVYRAQQHPIFAQIWEQRRTTAAVVAGFANLEQAVAQVATSIRADFDSLSIALLSAQREVTSTLKDGISIATSRAIDANSKDMRQLNSRAASIRDELHHINWSRR